MKKLLILSVAAAFFLAACGDSGTTDDPTKDGGTNGSGDPIADLTVSETNTSFVSKFSGTNCPPCGGWGWTAYSDIIAGTPNSVHATLYSQNFVAKYYITQEASDIDDKYGVTGYPTYGVNGTGYLERREDDPRYIDVNKTIQVVSDKAAAHENGTVEMNTAISYKIENGKIKVFYKAKAFKDMPENNFLAIYILEDKVVGYQAGHSDGNNAVHKHVLRDGIKGTWGIELGAMTSGQEISGSEEIEVGTDPDFNTEWNTDNIEVIGVMRYKIGNSGAIYEFVNACEGERL
jgi:hypothetical protein